MGRGREDERSVRKGGEGRIRMSMIGAGTEGGMEGDECNWSDEGSGKKNERRADEESR